MSNNRTATKPAKRVKIAKPADPVQPPQVEVITQEQAILRVLANIQARLAGIEAKLEAITVEE